MIASRREKSLALLWVIEPCECVSFFFTTFLVCVIIFNVVQNNEAQFLIPNFLFCVDFTETITQYRCELHWFEKCDKIFLTSPVSFFFNACMDKSFYSSWKKEKFVSIKIFFAFRIFLPFFACNSLQKRLSPGLTSEKQTEINRAKVVRGCGGGWKTEVCLSLHFCTHKLHLRKLISSLNILLGNVSLEGKEALLWRLAGRPIFYLCAANAFFFVWAPCITVEWYLINEQRWMLPGLYMWAAVSPSILVSVFAHKETKYRLSLSKFYNGLCNHAVGSNVIGWND